MTQAPSMQVPGLPIAVLPSDEPVARLAAGELARYLYQLSGEPSVVRSKLPKKGDCVVLDTDTRLGPNGYRVSVKPRGPFRSLTIAGADMPGILYGVYALTEHWGMRFTPGGDIWPATPPRLEVADDLELLGTPACRQRALILASGVHHFWGLEHYRFFLDQAARLRVNTVLVQRQLPGRAEEPLRTTELPYGSGRCFDEEFWSSPAGDDRPDAMTEQKQQEAIFRAAIDYAAYHGIRVGAGFMCPGGGDQEKVLEQAFRQLIVTSPKLSSLVVWSPGSESCAEMAAKVARTSSIPLIVIGDQVKVLPADAIHLGPHQPDDWLTVEPRDALPDWDLRTSYDARLNWEPGLAFEDWCRDLAKQVAGPYLEQRLGNLLASGEQQLASVVEQVPGHLQPQSRYALERLSAWQQLATEVTPNALRAFAGRLLLRSDWAILADLPYDDLDLPFELIAKGRRDEAWLSWAPVPGATLYRLRRQFAGGEWTTIRELTDCLATDDTVEKAADYQVIALDESSQELARSCQASATCGEVAPPPVILACKPYTHLLPGEGYLQRVVVRCDRELGLLNLVFRLAGDDEWWALPMHHRFRDSYQAMIPADQLAPGTLEFFVEAADEEGNRATWPPGAEHLPWSLTITG